MNNMSKRLKKRTKKYTGEDAKVSTQEQTVVHRYEAVERSRLGEWWQGKKKFAKPVGITAFIVIFVAFMITEIISLAT